MALNTVFSQSMTQLRLRLRLASSAIVLLLLGGCATAPSHLQAPSADAPGIKQVRADAEANLNKSVRWGGTVAGIQNLNGQTRVEVIAKPLLRNGAPDSNQVSQGRFIAVFDEFLDPSDYKKDSPLTVVGVVTGTELGKVGEAEYDFPQVQATAHQLWTGNNSRFARRSDYGYANSYYGYRPYGLRGHFGFGFGHRGFGHFGYGHRGFGRHGFRHGFGIGFGGRYYRNSGFYGLRASSLHFNYGHRRGSRFRR